MYYPMGVSQGVPAPYAPNNADFGMQPSTFTPRRVQNRVPVPFAPQVVSREAPQAAPVSREEAPARFNPGEYENMYQPSSTQYNYVPVYNVASDVSTQKSVQVKPVSAPKGNQIGAVTQSMKLKPMYQQPIIPGTDL